MQSAKQLIILLYVIAYQVLTVIHFLDVNKVSLQPTTYLYYFLHLQLLFVKSLNIRVILPLVEVMQYVAS